MRQLYCTECGAIVTAGGLFGDIPHVCAPAPSSRCAGCDRRLYYHEREAHPQEFCFECATGRGLSRLCDRARQAPR